jgi:hypothetical protein
MASEIIADPDLDWLDHVQPVGVVVAPVLIKEQGLTPIRQTPIDTGLAAELLEPDAAKPALPDPWKFFQAVLGWEARHVAGAPGGPAMPPELLVALPEHDTVLQPTWAVAELGEGPQRWQLLIRIESAGVDADTRGTLDGWEATPRQRFERLLRGTGVFAGVLVTDQALLLIYAPRGETSGHLAFPLRALGTVAGRPMLSGLKLMLDGFRLFSDADDRRLPSILARSRDAQASVSSALADQVLGALQELLRGLDGAEPYLIRELAKSQPDRLYEGLLAMLMRLVFILYAEDRDLLPSRADGRAREIFETSYSVRGLFARLAEDAALNPDTMDERRGGWGRLLALFRLIHKGHPTRFVQARGGKLFDPDEFLFLEGRISKDDPPRILKISDGCLLRVLEGLMTLKLRGGTRERLSYRTLDVEQIGSVYETVMGFTVETAAGRALPIKAGKNNRTPVFVNLDKLLASKGKNRIKYLRENSGRGQISADHAKAIEAARSVEDLVSALDSLVDERAAPRHRIAPVGTPILQPTSERRSTGSHYTPRSLTAPIVKFALEPAFERLGPDATPEQVLDLNVCDPAMGSGAFLVEACRAIGERLVKAWARWPKRRPVIPADEDEELHARRVVAQRCIYGVDKNPRAVDLARLSLWLATLARDHEFTFLDHALKCGDSLVGLSRGQMTSLHWDANAGLPLFDSLLRERFDAAVSARREIREAPDDIARVVQETRYGEIERRLHNTRLIGTAIIGAFFAADKPRAREAKRQEIETWANGRAEEIWPRLEAFARQLRSGDHPIQPFHWEIEFPEVFARENPGFDAIVGNPPFAGKNTIIAGNAKNYLPWLQNLHPGAHGNSDLVAHFFRRAFGLLRRSGVFGLIATNTIGQGDTRATGLTHILASGGAIIRATRRLKWPGEAAVVVSVVHVIKGEATASVLDSRPVRRVSAYLVEGELDDSPGALVANSAKAFIGSQVLGMGFTFDDTAAAKGESESIATMRSLIESSSRNSLCIRPYIGGEEVNTDPRQGHDRYVINFCDWPLQRDSTLTPWSDLGARERARLRTLGVVPGDYPGEVAEDWPDLIEILRRRVKPERDIQKRDAVRERWWQYAEKRPGLYATIASQKQVLVATRHAPNWALTYISTGVVFAESLVVFSSEAAQFFAILQSRAHEVWARFFASTLEDRLRYSPTDCFRTFPFPDNFGAQAALQIAGDAYCMYRAQLMIERNDGLTKIYNRLHARDESAPSIARLRTLHFELDTAVLQAYGWQDLANRAMPEFIEQDTEDGKAHKTRLDWPADIKDEVLARLLALNAERAAAERAASLAPSTLDDDEELSHENEGETE